MDRDQVLNKLEDLTDKILRHGKHVLPHVARLCLVGTFIEDGIRMWVQWGGQRDYMTKLWGVHYFFGTLFVIVNLLGQLSGAALVLTRRHVNIGIGILAFIVVLQTFAYNIVPDLRYFMKNLALIGGLILLLAESKAQGRSLFAGLPSMGENSGKTYLQLSGRLLLVLMFITLVRFDYSLYVTLINAAGGLLALLIAVGYKAKLASLTLVTLLTCLNFYANCWWNYSYEKNTRDYLKYEFFQVFSVVGGLLLVVALGPGGYSVDEHKKRW